MYRIVKVDTYKVKIIDVIYDNIETIEEAEEKLIKTLSKIVDNIEEYDIEAIADQGYKDLDNYSINIEEDGIIFGA